jgi:ribosomal protein S18 acetylase RimI-like enzyme
MNMKYRFATLSDIPILAFMNLQLTEDENHRNRFKAEQWFRDRMEQFIKGDYKSVLFEKEGKVLSYALYRNHPDYDDTIYLRQIFVKRENRRQGIGQEVMNILRTDIWPKEKRLTVEVLSHNEVARKFFQSVGYKDYSLELEIKPEERNLYSAPAQGT